MKQNVSSEYRHPKPIFDTLEHLSDQYKTHLKERNNLSIWLQQCLGEHFEELSECAIPEYEQAFLFLYNYRGSLDTFNSYRREIERFLQWAWFIHKKPIRDLKRLDIEAFLEFSQKPPKNWIGTKVTHRFINQEGQRVSHPDWRPFIVKVSKKDFKEGIRAKKQDFSLSQQGMKQIFAILGAFYNALIQEEFTEINPLLQIRQKSKFLQKQQSVRAIRRLSKAQWEAVLESATDMTAENPKIHKRTLFIMQCLYGMYLRISELAASKRWTPKMSDFFRDHENNWWFRTVGKGNKMRQIAVSSKMLQALREYRESLGYSPLPSSDDHRPLIPKFKGKGAISSTGPIRNLVQECFDQAIEKLQKEDKHDEAEMLRSATVHWLRHTGISEDVKIRPREHVRDDAGHSSSAITDRYINIELKERAKSAKNKGF